MCEPGRVLALLPLVFTMAHLTLDEREIATICNSQCRIQSIFGALMP
jgi:hypothetical protein